ncbi:hypothetical protein [Rathayibacter festucae]|uniref:hypothetical protein n=1 Tax=Rathayibacter festucae TaxID=110937 RepID=UPI002A6B1980|nr:hypothetical protein [Rathayibacter festucae]MDY0911299.1 hypothetical protein [Rathayibacter festucae]
MLDVELCGRIRGEGADERAHPEASEGIDEATDVEQLVAESPRLEDLVYGIEIGLPPGRSCKSEGVTEERLKRVSDCCRIGRARDADPTVRQLMCDVGDENVGSQPIEGDEEIRSQRIGVGDAPGGIDRAIDPIAEVLWKTYGIDRRHYSSVGDLLAVPVALHGGDALPLEAERKVGQDFDAGRVLQNVVVMPSADRREAYAPAVRPNPTSSDDEVIAIGEEALLLREASGLPTTPDGARPIALVHEHLLASLNSTRAMTARRLVGHFSKAKIRRFRPDDNTQMVVAETSDRLVGCAVGHEPRRQAGRCALSGARVPGRRSAVPADDRTEHADVLEFSRREGSGGRSCLGSSTDQDDDDPAEGRSVGTSMRIRERTPSPSRSGARAVTVLAVVTAVLSGCALGLPPLDGYAAPPPAPSAVPSVDGPGQSVPLDLEAFDAINRETVASIGDPSGADLTRALIAGSVDRAGLEITADITTPIRGRMRSSSR